MQNRRMKLNQISTVAISIIAILISSITAYYQFFFINSSLAVSAMDIRKREDGYYTELIVSNTGNRPVTIANIHFALIDNKVESFETSEEWEYVETYVDEVYSDIVLSNTLVLVRPEEVKVLRLKTSFGNSNFSDLNYKYGLFPKINNLDSKNNAFNVGIIFTIYTTEAKQSYFGLMPFEVEFDSNGFPVRFYRGEHYETEYWKKFNLNNVIGVEFEYIAG